MHHRYASSTNEGECVRFTMRNNNSYTSHQAQRPGKNTTIDKAHSSNPRTLAVNQTRLAIEKKVSRVSHVLGKKKLDAIVYTHVQYTVALHAEPYEGEIQFF